jgi:hypothetical protein
MTHEIISPLARGFHGRLRTGTASLGAAQVWFDKRPMHSDWFPRQLGAMQLIDSILSLCLLLVFHHGVSLAGPLFPIQIDAYKARFYTVRERKSIHNISFSNLWVQSRHKEDPSVHGRYRPTAAVAIRRSIAAAGRRRSNLLVLLGNLAFGGIHDDVKAKSEMVDLECKVLTLLH